MNIYLLNLKNLHTLRFEDFQQVTQYRNDYRTNSMVEKIEVWLVGGKRHQELIHAQDRETNVKVVLFSDPISAARHQFNWLISQLMH